MQLATYVAPRGFNNKNYYKNILTFYNMSSKISITIKGINLREPGIMYTLPPPLLNCSHYTAVQSQARLSSRNCTSFCSGCQILMEVTHFQTKLRELAVCIEVCVSQFSSPLHLIAYVIQLSKGPSTITTVPIPIVG